MSKASKKDNWSKYDKAIIGSFTIKGKRMSNAFRFSADCPLDLSQLAYSKIKSKKEQDVMQKKNNIKLPYQQKIPAEFADSKEASLAIH